MKPNAVGHAQGGTTSPGNSHTQPAGLVAGTLVMTGDGEIPVEFLAPGDRVISRAHGMVRLRDVSSETRRVHMVRLAPGAMGVGQTKATILPAAQTVLLRGAAAERLCGTAQGVTPVGLLVDDEGIRDLGPRDLRLIRLQFDRPEVIYADGVEIVLTSQHSVTPRAA